MPGWILLMLVALPPATGQAQPYRASVLWAPSDSLAPERPAGPAMPDSAAAPAFHSPGANAFDPMTGEPPFLTPVFGGIVGGAAFGLGGILIGNAIDHDS